MIKPILIESKEYSDIQLGMNGILHLESGKSIALRKYQYIILIDTEAEIVEGDYVNTELEDVFGPYEPGDIIGKAPKIVCSTDESLRLIKLSSKSIQLLIDYYNDHGCMPESVEVEEDMVDNPEFNRNKGVCKSNPTYLIKPKLNQQGEIDITIPEKPLHRQIIDAVGGEEAFCKAAGINIPEVEESNYIKFLNERIEKASSDNSKSAYIIAKNVFETQKIYTENEVYNLLSSMRVKFHLHRGVQIMDDELKEWFNSKKK